MSSNCWFPLQSEWQQVSSSLKDSTQYSGHNDVADLMDKINKNRHVGERGEELSPRFIKLPFFYLLIYFIFFYVSNFTVSWNYGNLTIFFKFIFFFS